MVNLYENQNAYQFKILNVEYQIKLAPAVPWNEGCPFINGPDIYGASPGKDFLYLIPTVGERPIRFFAENLPPGLFVEKDKGLIKGRAERKGEYEDISHTDR